MKHLSKLAALILLCSALPSFSQGRLSEVEAIVRALSRLKNESYWTRFERILGRTSWRETLGESSLRSAWENPRFRLLIYDEMMSAAPEETIALLAEVERISPAEVRRVSALRARDEWLPRELNRSEKAPIRVEESTEFLRLLKRERNKRISEESRGGFEVCLGSEITATLYASHGSRGAELALSTNGTMKATIKSTMGVAATIVFSRNGITREYEPNLELRLPLSLGDLSSPNGSTKTLPPPDFIATYEHLDSQRRLAGFYLGPICLGSEGASFTVGYGNTRITIATSGSVQLKAGTEIFGL